MTVGELTERLLAEHPKWTAKKAEREARRICAWTEQIQFQLEVEADLAALPVKWDAAA